MTTTAPGQKSALLVNASGTTTSIAIWVELRDRPQPKPIAWICAALPDQGFTTIRWETAYDYIWANTGKLVAGKTILVAERLAVTEQRRAVRLEKDGGGYRFAAYDPTPPPTSTTLLIDVADGIPAGQLTVGVNLRIVSGIGQPGNGCSVVQAEPNVPRQWTTGETYFASFGAVYQSQFDPRFASGLPPLQLDFTGGPDVGLLLDASNRLRQMTNAMLAALRRVG